MTNGNQQQLPLPNNNLGIQTRPPLGAGILQNMNPFMTNMQPMVNPLPFMQAANNFHPLQNNQLVPPHLTLLGQQNGVGNMNCNPLFPAQGQNMVNGGQFNLSQAQGHILAQNIASLLQQNNMNMQNGQFCAPLPLQNMNQQLPMQVSNPAQVIPYGMPPGSHPMCSFPNQVPQAMIPQTPFSSAPMQLNNVPGNQVPQAMVPQNPFCSANLPLNHVPGNQVRPQFNQNEKNMFSPGKTNAFTSSPFASQQLEGNTRAPPNPNGLKQLHAKHSQPAFSNSQANPMNNVKANAPNPNWKGSLSKNLKNNPNRGRFQGGFQKSKFHDINKGKKKFGTPKEHRPKGFNNEKVGNSGSNYKEQNKELKRSLSVIYTDQEIQQWREARKKNYPTKGNIQKKQKEQQSALKVTDREVFRRELKEILAKQAELGVEVAEIPSYYLKDSRTKGFEGGEKRNSSNKRKFKNKFDKRTDRKGRYSKKQKFANKDVAPDPSSDKRSPTLLQKLLSADIKRDKSHLFQAFRFMVMNSFFQEWPDKPLRYPSVMVKENGPEGGDQDLVNLINDKRGDVIEDGDCDDNENDCIEQVNPQEECPDGEFEESEEEGEIVD
ncbi:uncharacterized protein LOC114754902 [Neltuma alba]|uniref:uncharacterized protein LOC114754880 n=1 Tax=Neltuma alba TaxID=207710 RepID=UPI0010A35931|nr:uncharacterized protein LOC114754880 [Prosopis alba]XP_028799550.1 uncharacterized protein LOC114754880 [Prosopis alba]XP_028799582.1 uncharacterized protein LOC114754902 [Prosopis alba]XP_028799583.1 uncharacterized protein LOC114754902 [Prosopis alba]